MCFVSTDCTNGVPASAAFQSDARLRDFRISLDDAYRCISQPETTLLAPHVTVYDSQAFAEICKLVRTWNGSPEIPSGRYSIYFVLETTGNWDLPVAGHSYTD